MTALRIFIYTPFSEASRKHILQTLQLTTTCEVVFSADLAEADALPYMRHCHVLMGNPPVQWFTGDLNELRFWQLDSTGFDQYRQLNIGTAVANMGDLYSQPCAETIVSGILAYYRHLPQLLQAKEQKQWVGRAIRPQLDLLRSKVVLLLGAGHIAMAIKNILEGFGCLIRISASLWPIIIRRKR
jgi:glyoxylate/hydroxypyruvate reductase